MFTTVAYYICIAVYYVTYWSFIVIVNVLDLLKYPLHPYMLALFIVAFGLYKLYKLKMIREGSHYIIDKQKRVDFVFHADTIDGHAAAWAFGDGVPVPKGAVALTTVFYEVAKAATKNLSKIVPNTELTGKSVVFIDVHPSVDELMLICAEATKVDIFSSIALNISGEKRLESLVLTGKLTYHIDVAKTGSMIAWEYTHKGIKVPTIISYVMDITLRTFTLIKSKEVAAYLNHNVKLYTFAEIANRKLATIDDIVKHYAAADAAAVAPKPKATTTIQRSSSNNLSMYYGYDFGVPTTPPAAAAPPANPKRPRLEQSLYHFVKLVEEGNKYLKLNVDIALKHEHIERKIKIKNVIYTGFLTVTIDSFVEAVSEHLLSVIDEASASASNSTTFAAIACYDIQNASYNLYIYSKAFDVANIAEHLGAVPESVRCETTHFATATVYGSSLPTWFRRA